MARKSPKNPLNDIVGQAGGWLGGAVSSLNTFLTGQDNPTVNPQTRRVISASQVVGDVVTGGAVSAMQQGPDAVRRYANTQIALAAAGLAAEPVVGAAVKGAKILKNPVTRAQVVRRGQDAAWKVGHTVSGYKPVLNKTVRDLRKSNAVRGQQLADLNEAHRLLRETIYDVDRLVDSRATKQAKQKTVEMANEFIKQYERNNPIYSRAEHMAFMESREAGTAIPSEDMPGYFEVPSRREVRKRLNKAANQEFSELMQGFAEQGLPLPQNATERLARDVREAQMYQRASGIMSRRGIETTRNLPVNTPEQIVAAEFRAMSLQDRLETQYLRSMMKRSNRRKPR